MSHPYPDRGAMGQAQRDSPEEPCTRASRSAEGEVCLFRDFPRGNQREGFWLLQARTVPPVCCSSLAPQSLAMSSNPCSLHIIPQSHLDLQRKA